MTPKTAQPVHSLGPRPECAPSGRVLIANSAADPQVYSQEPGYTVAVVGRYLIHIHTERTTSTTVGVVRRALADLEARYDKFGYLCVMERSSELILPSDVRASIDVYVKRYSSRFTGAAIVFEEPGFRATVVRSLVTAVNVASRASHPTQVFDALQAGIAWLGGITPGEPTPTRLHQIVEQLRAPPK